MLSLTKGTVIAKTNTGRYIRLIDSPSGDDEPIDNLHAAKFIPDDFFRQFGVRPMDFARVRRAIEHGDPSGLSPAATHAYNNSEEALIEASKKNFYIPEGEGDVSWMPPIDYATKTSKWFTLFVNGPTGSGKTHFIRELIKRMPDKRPIHLFSPLTDGDYDVLDEPIKNGHAGGDTIGRLNKYVIDGELCENPFDIEELGKHCIVIFDDIESIKQPAVRSSIGDFRDQCLQTGRHYDIITIVVYHNPLSGRETSTITNECEYFCCFPRSNPQGVCDFLEKRCGFRTDIQRMIKDMKTRPLLIKRSYPIYMVYDRGVTVL